jgi:hypothetical protein
VAEKEHQVLLVHQDANAVDGMHVYRAEELPEPDQVITVEVALSPAPSPGPPESGLARVTSVVPDDRFPVRATLLEP